MSSVRSWLELTSELVFDAANASIRINGGFFFRSSSFSAKHQPSKKLMFNFEFWYDRKGYFSQPIDLKLAHRCGYPQFVGLVARDFKAKKGSHSFSCLKLAYHLVPVFGVVKPLSLVTFNYPFF